MFDGMEYYNFDGTPSNNNGKLILLAIFLLGVAVGLML